MSEIEVFTGPYRTGKSLKLLERVLDYLDENRPGEALLVVPSHRYRKLITERLLTLVKQRQSDGDEKHRDFPGVFGLKILSFYKLLEEILRKLGVSFRLMPEKVRPVLMQQILLSMREEGLLDSIGPIVEFAGTSQQIVELIDEFERAALSPEDVITRLERNVESGSKYMELARIYDRYWKELAKLGYVDQRIVSFKLREALTSETRDLSLGFLAVDGFDRFNPLQLQAVSLLSPYCKKVEVLFDYLRPEEDPNNDYLWKDDSYRDLETILAGNLIVKPLAEPAPSLVVAEIPAAKPKRRRQGGGDNALQLSLFAMADSLGITAPGDVPETVGRAQRTYTVEKFRAMDRYFEMDFIASKIKQRLVLDDVLPSEILVVIRDLKVYRTAVRTAFEGASIPHYLDESIALQSLPLAQWIEQLLTLSLNDYPRSETIKFLRSPFTMLSAFGLTLEDVELLDQTSLKDCVVVSGQSEWEDCARVLGIVSVKEGLGKFFELTTPVRGVREHTEWVSWLEDLFDTAFAKPIEDDEEVPQIKWQRETTLSVLRQSFALLIKESTILQGITHTYDQFARKLLHMLEQSSFRSPGEGLNQVRICSAELAPNKTFTDIYLAGLVEGEFPRRVSRSGFASPEEIKKWKFFGIDLHNPRHHPGFESALFNSLLERARERIIITCPATEITDGEELIPSFLLTGGKEEGLRSIQPIDPYEGSTNLPVSVRDLVSNRLWRNQNEAMVAMAHPDVAEFTERISQPIEMLKARESGASRLVYNGWLTDLVASGSLQIRMPGQWSASRLNDYGKCPFRYWTNHVLRIKPHEEPTNDLLVTVLGETYHKALELFYKELSERKLKLIDATDDEIERILQSVVKTSITSLNARQDVRRGEFSTYENQEIAFRLSRFIQEEKKRSIKDEGRFTPSLFEHGFGRGRDGTPTSAALVLKVGGKSVTVVGVIDRIDLSEERSSNGMQKVRVIDYKSGSTRITKRDVLAGRNLQMPIYALAVSQSIMPGAEVESGGFLSVSQASSIGALEFSPKARRPKEGEEPAPPENLLETATSFIVDYVSRIEKGDFEVKPNGEVSCKGCPHSMICRVGECGSSSSEESD